MPDVGEPIEVQAVVVVRIFPAELEEAGGSVLQAMQNLLGSTVELDQAIAPHSGRMTFTRQYRGYSGIDDLQHAGASDGHACRIVIHGGRVVCPGAYLRRAA